ncbi:DUF4097 family beta strand repeat-containing protein [Asanoa sp. WMMD1127]|uniref:DUF4097 family beta strand repeat-containing protein n=1 Tax=Asanoa sp. WMMD1127 TaxID=3016107 RepID=UPI002415BCB6|nr:DUF4097 family beta strand repeat-containing protein [Asanoa sp. WMMD1127]MDG4823250.1 DUF4097 family beta strand repeat-containing protein [Asanoa sp. WMMD1127]
MPTFATPQPITATVEVAGAQVRVNATDRADTAVTVAPLDPSSRKDVKVAERTRVDYAAGQLRVKTTVSGDKNGSVAITIDVPAGSHLAAYLAHSDIHAAGPLGSGDLHIASGRVALDRLDALTANLSSGSVTVGHVAGGAQVDGGAYTLRIGEITGAARIENAGGQVSIGHAQARVELRSASGDLDIEQADADVAAQTASGAIRIGRLTRGQAELTNASGNIEVGIPTGATAYIAAKSDRGAVSDYVSDQPGGGDEVTVHARTRHGDIIIRPATR